MLASFFPADWEWLHDREEKSDIDCLWTRWKKQFFDEISRFIPVASPVYSPRKKIAAVVDLSTPTVDLLQKQDVSSR